jgi:Uncharacterised nucleotidyltransferase
VTATEGALEYLLALARVWIEGGAAPPREGSVVPAWPADPEVADPADRLARAHGLLPWLHWMAERHPATRPPEAERLAAWEHERFETFAFQSALYDLLERVVVGCRAAGRDVVILKGPAAAARIWGDVGLRPTGDLDLLCRRPDLSVVAEVLRGVGCAAREHTATYHLRFEAERPPPGPGAESNSSPDFVLELHFGLYDFLAAGELPEALWESIVEIDLDGRRVPALSPEAALAFGIAHAIHHDGALRLPQLMELAAAIWRGLADSEATAVLLGRAGLADEAAVVVRTLGRLFALPAAPAALAAPSGLAPLDEGFALAVRRAVERREEDEGLVPLAETLSRSGWQRLSHALRLALPPQEELRALYGCGWLAALARRPLHLAGAARRGLRKARARRLARRLAPRPDGGALPLGVERPASLKREVYRRLAGGAGP